MALITFHLLAIKPSMDSEPFTSKLRSLTGLKRPFWVGQVHHWLHEPHLSANALLGTEQHIINWNYLLIGKQDIPDELKTHLLKHWSITANVPDGMASPQAKIQSLVAQPAPTLPSGWSAEDHAGLDIATAPGDLAFTLEKRSRPLGSARSGDGKTLREFVREFGISHPGPVIVFNLLSYLPDKRPIYIDGYIGGFGKTIGPMYGGDAIQFGFGATEWTSQFDEPTQEDGWEDAALVWYPSIWHFAKMIDDAEYAELDRKFKPTSLRDNPLLCCTEIEL